MQPWIRNNRLLVDALGRPLLCDECPCGGEFVTHRRFDFTANDFATTLWAADLGEFIAPTGTDSIRSMARDLDSGANMLWVATTRNNGYSAYRCTYDSGLPDGATFDHGGDARVIRRQYSGYLETDRWIIGGDPGTNSRTIRKFSGTTQAWENAALDTRCNTIIAGRVLNGTGKEGYVAGGLGTSHTLALIRYTNGTTVWTMDPTSGSGEAVSLWAQSLDYFYALYTGITSGNPTVFGITPVNDPPSVFESFDVRSGEVNTSLFVTGSSPNRLFVVGGESDGSNTITCYSESAAGILWETDTGSTVRQMQFGGSGIFAVGDENLSGYSAWLIDVSDGSIDAQFQHGGDLYAIDIIDGFTSKDGSIVGGARVSA